MGEAAGESPPGPPGLLGQLLLLLLLPVPQLANWPWRRASAVEGEEGSGDRILNAEADTVCQEKVRLTSVFFFFFLLLDAWRGKFGRKFHYSRICRENQKCFLKSVWELYPWNLLKIIVPLQCFNWEINSTRKSQFWVSVVCLHLKSKIKFFQFKGSSV